MEKKMDVKLEISAEDINRELTAAVAKSLIGEKIQEIIKEEVRRLSACYNNPLEPVVRGIINNMVRDMILTEFKEPIEKLVRERLTTEIQTTLIDKAWQALMNH
jgi:hypothetical protein